MSNILLALLAVAAIGVLCLIFTFIKTFMCCSEELERQREKKIKKRVADTINDAAYWFCEDDTTERLLHNLAYQIDEYGTVHPDKLRQAWRTDKRINKS